MMLRVLYVLYFLTLVLLPWAWFPPFPWLHVHAQWRDAVFAVTAGVWVVERWRAGQWPRLRPTHVAMACYLGAAAVSTAVASPDKRLAVMKLIGMTELCVFAVVTGDLASRPQGPRIIARAIVTTSLLTAAAAIAGIVLFYAGMPTRLIGAYGDLEYSSWYARVQAGTYQPNLLASFCIFASAVVAMRDARLPSGLRRITQALLLLTALMTLSRGILAFVLAAAIRAAHTKTRRLLTGVYAMVCVMIIAALTVWNLSFNPARPFEARLISGAASSRWSTLTSSLNTLAAHPLVGSGVGTSPGLYRGAPFDAHLTPLNIAATMGVPALIAFSLIFIFLWRDRSRSRNGPDLAVWSGLAGLGLDALAQDIEDFHHLWALIGLASADTGSPDRHSSKEPITPIDLPSS
jgi:hypothetical protein